MTNREAYKNEIIKISLDGDGWGVHKDTRRPMPCHELCDENGEHKCLFRDYLIYTCHLGKQEWLDEVCFERTVNWTKIPVDTPVKYRVNGIWHNGYFAGCLDGLPYIFTNGKTSRTAPKDPFWFCGKWGLHPTDLMLDKEI